MKQQLRQALSRRQKRSAVEPDRVLSAVLLPLSHKEGQHYLLFVKRTQKVKEHKGQISFPGGAYDEGDGTLLSTALRESAEEIGLAPTDVEILGMLDDTLTETSSYVISPFVGFIPSPYRFEVNQEEVEEIIEVPISALLEGNCRREETEVREGKTVTAYFYHYGRRVIWGATARILNQFLDIWAQLLQAH